MTDVEIAVFFLVVLVLLGIAGYFAYERYFKKKSNNANDKKNDE